MGCIESLEKKPLRVVERQVSKVGNSSDKTLRLKLLLLGTSGVGKTSLMTRYVDDTYTPSKLSTIGIDYKNKIVTLNKIKHFLQIWDTAGQERFSSITKTYYRGAHGIAVVFDLTDYESFLGLKKWLGEENGDSENTDLSTRVRVLVGNKSDQKDRVVTLEQAQQYARNRNIRYFETSAATGVGVNEMFDYLTLEASKERNSL